MSTYILAGGLRQGSPERRVVAAAMTPAVHSVQAWRFRVVPGLIEIRADVARFRTMMDPRARSVHLSSGAALFNLRLAAAQLGREPVVRLLPDHSRPGLLGTLRLAGPHRTTAFERRLYAATLKPTQTRRAPSAPLHETSHEHETLHEDKSSHAHQGLYEGDASLQQAASHGVARPAVAELTEAARLEGAALRRLPSTDETESWLLSTPGDGPMAWLRAGQALQRVILTAAAQSIPVSFRYEAVNHQAEHGESPQALIQLGQTV